MAWIRSGELGAINTAGVRCGRPRYVILPSHLAAFTTARQVGARAAATPRRRQRVAAVDYFPEF
jgi:hypothetical protein